MVKETPASEVLSLDSTDAHECILFESPNRKPKSHLLEGNFQSTILFRVFSSRGTEKHTQ